MLRIRLRFKAFGPPSPLEGGPLPHSNSALSEPIADACAQYPRIELVAGCQLLRAGGVIPVRAWPHEIALGIEREAKALVTQRHVDACLKDHAHLVVER
jgi:hypothetical protein